MKLVKNTYFWILAILLSGYAYMASCTRQDSLIVPIETSKPFSATRNNAVLLPGSMTAGNTNEWKLDKVHSNVMWSSNYVGAAGLLTGRFNQFGMAEVTDAAAINYSTTGQPIKDNAWAFYENDPSKTFFNGYVQINTSNTGEPGRDGGCNIAAMGTVPIVAGTQNLTAANLAKIKTTKVELD